MRFHAHELTQPYHHEDGGFSVLVGRDTWSLESLKVKMLPVYERNRETGTYSKRRTRVC